MQYQKELQFYNIYTQKDDTFTLKWTFYDGFESLESARIALLAAGQNPENFIYIKHHGFLYAVAANLMEQALVFCQDFVWYREPSSEIIRRCPRDSYTRVPYVIQRVNSFQYYKITMCQDLSFFDPAMKLIPGLNVKNTDKIYKNFCVATLGAVMVASLIPSYQLCCMDIYLQDITPFLQVWELGIKSYNPFNGAREIAPYTMESYLKDSNTMQDDIRDFTYLRNVLLNMGVMMDASLGETLKLPFHFGRKFVYALNMLLSDLGDTTITSENTNSMQLGSVLSDMAQNPNAALAEKSLHFCRICHTSLPSDITDNICPICKEQELFMAVKDYIREKDVSEREVADFFQIPVYKVREWIREGRISYKESPGMLAEKVKPIVRCRECGVLLPSNSNDNICRSCAELLDASKAHKNKQIMGVSQTDETKAAPTNRYFH